MVLHSGSYDRMYNALTVALTASAMGRPVSLLFTYWSLEYLRRDRGPALLLDNEAENHRSVIQGNLAAGRMHDIAELLDSAKELGISMYACVGSVSLLGMTRDELSEQIDDAIGMAEFLRSSEDDQLLFI